MSTVFETYKSRAITFDRCMGINDWMVKVYTITNKSKFGSEGILRNCKTHLPAWLKGVENSTLPVYKHAFLIVHEAREGAWILLNWWTGGEMIETKVFFSSFDAPSTIKDSPYSTNALLCVWELEVFAHERASWIEHILSKADHPDYTAYANDTLCKRI